MQSSDQSWHKRALSIPRTSVGAAWAQLLGMGGWHWREVEVPTLLPSLKLKNGVTVPAGGSRSSAALLHCSQPRLPLPRLRLNVRGAPTQSRPVVKG